MYCLFLIKCCSLQIELDFEQLYPGKDLIFFTNFELFKTKIPNLIRKNKYIGIDNLIDEILNPTVLGKFKCKHFKNVFEMLIVNTYYIFCQFEN